MFKKFVVLLTLGVALPAHAQSDPQIRLSEAPSKECPGEPTVGGNDNFWIDCRVSCPRGTLLLGGACNAGNTHGESLVLESFGIEDGAWKCRYVDARNIGIRPLVPGLRVKATPICISR
jgi:hypothetical protein